MKNKKIFSPFKMKNMELKNRVVMPPMCMFCAGSDGMVTDFHIHHYSARALGGVGLIIVEATAVSPEGRITDGDLGIWSDDHVAGLKKIVDAVHGYGAKIGIQLAHAGRKAVCEAKPAISVTDKKYSDHYDEPVQMSEDMIVEMADKFGQGASRAEKAGFDFVEIHGAHGYLLSSFFSPLSNTRQDHWGGDSLKRLEFLKLITEKVKTHWPSQKPIGLRISATDYVEGGISAQDVDAIVEAAMELDIDLINVSTGGVVSHVPEVYPGYQLKYAERIKRKYDVGVLAGGLISSPDLAMELIENDRADLVYIGRELLRNPFWVHGLAKLTATEGIIPEPYFRAWK